MLSGVPDKGTGEGKRGGAGLMKAVRSPKVTSALTRRPLPIYYCVCCVIFSNIYIYMYIYIYIYYYLPCLHCEERRSGRTRVARGDLLLVLCLFSGSISLLMIIVLLLSLLLLLLVVVVVVVVVACFFSRCFLISHHFLRR